MFTANSSSPGGRTGLFHRERQAYSSLVRIVCFLLFLLLPAVAAAFQLPGADTQATSLLQQDFIKFDKHYLQEKPLRTARLHELAARMYTAERNGISNACGHQMLFEVEELMVTSAHFDKIDSELDRLDSALQRPAADQQDGDGIWGNCTEQWYLKLYDTYDRLEAAEPGSYKPHTPLPKFLSRVATPEKLTAYLDRLSVSDVARTGVDNGLEFNQTLAILLRMLVLGEPQEFQVDPALKQALLGRILHEYRNPASGYWGERYQRGNRIDFQDDLSTTFHIVSFLKGQVPFMDKVTDTTLAIRTLDYPVGWLWKGQFWNHNNMDVVTLFRYSWPTATEEQRKAMHDEIARMLKWCLAESFRSDGSFEVNIADGSVEDAEYYGTAFLSRIGYFNPRLRFWTSDNLPNTGEVRMKITAFVQRHQAENSMGDHYKRVFEELER